MSELVNLTPQMGSAPCAAPDLSSRQCCNILLFPALEKIKDFITCYWPFSAINEQLSALQVFVPFLQGFSPLLGAKDLLGLLFITFPTANIRRIRDEL